MSCDVVVASSSEENRVIVVADQVERPVLWRSQHGSGKRRIRVRSYCRRKRGMLAGVVGTRV
jgi:hypothetical protein